MTYIIWDTETTGLNPLVDDIIEVGMRVVHDDGTHTDHQWLLDHDRPVPDHIVKITGITTELLKAEGRSPYEVFADVDALLVAQGSQLQVCHNGLRFDADFLAQSMKRHGLTHAAASYRRWLTDRMTDTAALFKARQLGWSRGPLETPAEFQARVLDHRVRGLRYNLAHCCATLGIDTTGITAHRALADVAMTHLVHNRLQEEHTP